MVLNTPCVVTTTEGLQRRLEKWAIESGKDKALSVDFTNVHIVAARHAEEQFREETDNVDLFVSDSQVLSWAISILGGREGERVYGPAFMAYCIENTSPRIRHYFLGGNQECLEALLKKIGATNDQMTIAGSRNGYFTQEEEEEIVAGIREVNPDYLWVGLGTPKQQQFISKWKDSLPGTVLLAVGFAFDVNAGTKKDAPGFLGPLGLTWLYRLAKEPSRLWKRYLIYNSIFLIGFVRQLISR